MIRSLYVTSGAACRLLSKYLSYSLGQHPQKEAAFAEKSDCAQIIECPAKPDRRNHANNRDRTRFWGCLLAWQDGLVRLGKFAAFINSTRLLFFSARTKRLIKFSLLFKMQASTEARFLCSRDTNHYDNRNRQSTQPGGSPIS